MSRRGRDEQPTRSAAQQPASTTATPPPADSLAPGGSEAGQEVSPQFTPEKAYVESEPGPSTQLVVTEVNHATKTVTVAEMGPASSDGTQENGCPAEHEKHGRCDRTDAHEWHRARGEKWSDGKIYNPKKGSSGAAVAKPEDPALGAPLTAEQITVAAGTVILPSGATMKVAVVAEGDERLRGRPFVLETDIPPEVAETLAKQQAAQVEPPKVDPSLAPRGTVRSVYTGSAASRLAPAIETEMKRILALKLTAKDLVPLKTEKPSDPPRAQCPGCDVIVVGFDPSHSCTKEDVLRKLKPRGMHEVLGDKLKFSGRYRLVLWRDKEGEYNLAEELVDENGSIVAFNVLDGPESWAYMGNRVLDLVVEKFTP